MVVVRSVITMKGPLSHTTVISFDTTAGLLARRVLDYTAYIVYSHTRFTIALYLLVLEFT